MNKVTSELLAPTRLIMWAQEPNCMKAAEQTQTVLACMTPYAIHDVMLFMPWHSLGTYVYHEVQLEILSSSSSSIQHSDETSKQLSQGSRSPPAWQCS